MTNKDYDSIKDKTATIRCNEDLMHKFKEVKEIISGGVGKEMSDGATWIVCLGLALENAIDTDLITSDKNVNIKKQIRVNNKALKDLEKLRDLLNEYTEIKSDVEVWRYSLKLTYRALVIDRDIAIRHKNVGDGNNVL